MRLKTPCSHMSLDSLMHCKRDPADQDEHNQTGDIESEPTHIGRVPITSSEIEHHPPDHEAR